MRLPPRAARLNSIEVFVPLPIEQFEDPPIAAEREQ
jgi:hypothetical protein